MHINEKSKARGDSSIAGLVAQAMSSGVLYLSAPLRRSLPKERTVNTRSFRLTSY